MQRTWRTFDYVSPGCKVDLVRQWTCSGLGSRLQPTSTGHGTASSAPGPRELDRSSVTSDQSDRLHWLSHRRVDWQLPLGLGSRMHGSEAVPSLTRIPSRTVRSTVGRSVGFSNGWTLRTAQRRASSSLPGSVPTRRCVIAPHASVKGYQLTCGSAHGTSERWRSRQPTTVLTWSFWQTAFELRGPGTPSTVRNAPSALVPTFPPLKLQDVHPGGTPNRHAGQ